MPHSKFGWSLPPGCTSLPGDMDDPDDTRCCRCHSDLDDAYDMWLYDEDEPSPDDTGTKTFENSPMFDGFCCWACARDYADAEATKPYYSHEMPRREEYRKLAAGDEAPPILPEEEAFGAEHYDGGYDPTDDPEFPEVQA